MKEKTDNEDLAAAAAKKEQEAALQAETDAKLKALNDKMSAERAEQEAAALEMQKKYE